MIAQVAKWGNSLALRIPKSFAQELAVEAGRQVEVTVENGSLIITPVESIPAFDLARLVEGITEDNRHDETETGFAVGQEFG